MEKVFAQWRNSKEYKQSSINKTIQCLKAFYRWLYGLTSHDPAPEVVRWLKKEKKPESIKCHKCGQTLDIGDRICPVCGLIQDNETATKHINEIEDALNIRKVIITLGRKYPELGELINKLIEKEKKLDTLC